MSVDAFMAVWLDDCAGRLTPKTLHGYRHLCGLPELARLGPADIRQVEPRMVSESETIAQLLAHHGRVSSLRAYRALSAMFGIAKRWGYIDSNPCRFVRAPIARVWPYVAWLCDLPCSPDNPCRQAHRPPQTAQAAGDQAGKSSRVSSRTGITNGE